MSSDTRIGGNVCVRDGDLHDYCWREAVQSLLPVCSTVTVCDGGSTDGTREAIESWSLRDSRVRLLDFPWPSPRGETHFWVRWLNWCRERISEPWHFQLDADEVLFESSYDWIREFVASAPHPASAWCARLNFWRDPFHLSPSGKMCGDRVARLASTSLWMPTDYPHPLGEELCARAVYSPVRIAHYGALRRRDAMALKQRAYMSWTVAGDLDPRLVAAESAANWCDSVATQCGWAHLVAPYHDDHPLLAHDWLRVHGYPPL